MRKNLLYVLSALVLLTGCRRDESQLNVKCTNGCAVFNIRVGAGEGSTDPVSGAHVDLAWQGSKGVFGGGSNSIDIANGITDANGNISMKFKAYGNEFTDGYFNITVSGPTNYFSSSQIVAGVRNPDTTLSTSVHLPYKAYLKIVMTNFSPSTPDDSFSVLPTFKMYGATVTDPSFATAPASSLYHPGGSAAFDSVTYTSPTGGNQYSYFSVVIERNGNRISHLDSLYIPKGTVGTYRVDYLQSFQ